MPTCLWMAAGVVWGWCVAGFAFLPYALYVLAAAPLLKAVGTLVLWLAATLVPLTLVDRHYYGRWTVSQTPQQEQWQKTNYLPQEPKRTPSVSTLAFQPVASQPAKPQFAVSGAI